MKGSSIRYKVSSRSIMWKLMGRKARKRENLLLPSIEDEEVVSLSTKESKGFSAIRIASSHQRESKGKLHFFELL
ncbi:hypothetical protein MA16_Dca018597 [Dendrobium catenatum]|uniref:Uncharacterized protein n=1 Tax=Dendrobium catenatum TaxID=906689 RepID=A0A2I0X2Q8_9ASPA|nr:hypothetical protein MA16_Dca018597 [Dendrobium catenatum]